MAGKWTQVGTIRKSKEKGNLYIKFHANKEKSGKYSAKNLRELADALENAGEDGLSLQIEKPKDKINRLCELGYIDEADLEARLEQVPDYIKYEISLPPQD